MPCMDSSFEFELGMIAVSEEAADPTPQTVSLVVEAAKADTSRRSWRSPSEAL